MNTHTNMEIRRKHNILTATEENENYICITKKMN
uniref:Uncharacterized protein n=2 Tax=Anguilla anguilla TaxID=7936 RepID=A0A0E9S4C8_ANGAN